MSSSGAGTAPWRQSLGRVGVWVGAGAVGQDPGGFAARVERLGYGAVWVGAATLTGMPSTCSSGPSPKRAGSW